MELTDNLVGLMSLHLTGSPQSQIPDLGFNPPYMPIVQDFQMVATLPGQELVIILLLGTINIPIHIPALRSSTINNHTGARQFYYKVNRILQDLGIYGDVFECAFLAHLGQNIYSYLPRPMLAKHFPLAGLIHLGTYVIYAKIINIRFWTLFQIRHVLTRETFPPVNPRARPVESFTTAQVIHEQCLLPPENYCWELPKRPSNVFKKKKKLAQNKK